MFNRNDFIDHLDDWVAYQGSPISILIASLYHGNAVNHELCHKVLQQLAGYVSEENSSTMARRLGRTLIMLSEYMQYNAEPMVRVCIVEYEDEEQLQIYHVTTNPNTYYNIDTTVVSAVEEFWENGHCHGIKQLV